MRDDRKECYHCGSRDIDPRDHGCNDCRRAAERRGREQRKQHEAWLRRQGYDEEYIRTH
jgi:hypothetical protein